MGYYLVGAGVKAGLTIFNLPAGVAVGAGVRLKKVLLTAWNPWLLIRAVIFNPCKIVPVFRSISGSRMNKRKAKPVIVAIAKSNNKKRTVNI